MAHSHEIDDTTSRKRKHGDAAQSSARKALRLNETLVGSNQEIDSLDEDNAAERTGAFAHIKSAKKRHKLEREARKARKASEKGETTEGAVVILSTNGAADRVAVRAPVEEIAKPAKKPKRQKEKAVEAVEDEEEEQRRLEKHASVLKKFDKAQKRAVGDQEQQGTAETNEERSRTVVDPLEPIHIDTTIPTTEITYSALPTWVTSARRLASTDNVAFQLLGLEESTISRLEKLGFASAMPVQQAILPLLLPPGTPGSGYKAGTDDLVPDLAVSAPTGSGKTLGYVLPIVQGLRTKQSVGPSLRALIVVPTRELVGQVAQLAESLTRGSGLSVGTASGGGRLKDEQQRLVNVQHAYMPQEHARMIDLAQRLANPPDEDTAAFDDYLLTVDSIDEHTWRQLDALPTCPAGFLPLHKSAIDILVSTPGRLLEHIDNTNGFDVSNIAWLVLDEADKLLDEQYDGFLDRLHQLLAAPHTPAQRSNREARLRELGLWQERKERRVRKVVLSATMTQDVSQLVSLKLERPQLVVVGSQEVSTEADAAVEAMSFELPATLKEFCVPVADGVRKPMYLVELLRSHVLESEEDSASSDDSASENESTSDSSSESAVSTDSSNAQTTAEVRDGKAPSKRPSAATVLVFTSSNEAALRLTHLLKRLLPRLAAQVTCFTKATSARNVDIRGLSSRPAIVVSTDRAGRGLDMVAGRAITHVVQYDVPRSIVSYVHRVGRTARAGRPGDAWTLYSNVEAKWFLNEVTRATSIGRLAPVERIKLQVRDEELQALYEETLEGMRDIVQSH